MPYTINRARWGAARARRRIQPRARFYGALYRRYRNTPLRYRVRKRSSRMAAYRYMRRNKC